MSVRIVVKDTFAVIGIMGQGLAVDGPKWIPALWQEANSRFEEIRDFVKTDFEGNLAGIWGAMSDVSEKFERWTETGKYLAGGEAEGDAEAPAGWTKWTIPAYRYAVIKCRPSTYQEQFQYMVHNYLPKHEYSIVGAVHEFYDPAETDESLYLYFPIEALG